MKKKVIISTIVSFVLLVAVIAAGINAVFTVSEVQTDFCVYSDDGRAEAAQLKEKLEKFVGKSSTFLNLTDVEKAIIEYPCLNVDYVEKKYPSTVCVGVSERKETYACAIEEGYAVLDEKGCYLYGKEENANRLGGENILFEGFAFSYREREVAQGEYSAEIFALFDTFAEYLNEVRANVLRVELRKYSSDERNHFFFIYMREGVAIRIKNPAAMTEKKASAAMETYLSLSDMQRTKGAIDVVDVAQSDTEVYASYSSDFIDYFVP